MIPTGALRSSSSAAARRFFATRPTGLVDRAKQQLKEIQEAGTYKSERVITSAQSSNITVSTSDRPVLNFCANNYLGLSNHPRLIEASKKAAETHGVGLSSVRFICGTQDIHKELEKQLSEFHGTEDTILYGSCFDANGGVFETLLGAEDVIISDKLNHASIIDGIRLSKSKRFLYNHLDMADLEQKLQDNQDAPIRLIVTDGVFSMDGDVAPLDKICALADKYNAHIFIDECHATGFFGKHGKGTPELFGVQDRIDVINSTLGKALGGASGGYTTGRKELIDLLRNRSRPYLFSNSIAPPVVAAAAEAIKILTESTELRDRLERNTTHFRKAMKAAGFRISGNDICPIAPVMIGDARIANQMSQDLLQRGLYVVGFSFPVVPKGEARIRVQLSAGHSTEDVDKAINAFIESGKKFGFIH